MLLLHEWHTAVLQAADAGASSVLERPEQRMHWHQHCRHDAFQPLWVAEVSLFIHRLSGKGGTRRLQVAELTFVSSCALARLSTAMAKNTFSRVSGVVWAQDYKSLNDFFCHFQTQSQAQQRISTSSIHRDSYTPWKRRVCLRWTLFEHLLLSH